MTKGGREGKGKPNWLHTRIIYAAVFIINLNLENFTSYMAQRTYIVG